MGLAISKTLANLMGGDVGVESEYGKGSTFWFTALLGKGIAKSRKFVPDPDLRGRRILVVDDNEMSLTVLSDMLADMTFVVNEVSSGKAALKEISAAAESGNPHEIVLLDWQMPEMNGIETARAIRKLPLSSIPHMIIVTAYGREEIIKEATLAGLENVLIKPVSASTMFDTLVQVLGGHSEEKMDAELQAAPLPENLDAIKGASILLVEDNEFNQQLATELLVDSGFRVDVAEDGQKSLEMLVKRDYDIVLMDMQMPVMDGITATVEIRKDMRFRDLPIIAMTANVMAVDIEKCHIAGMNDHIGKPIDPDDLFNKLLKWVKPPKTKYVREPSQKSSADVITDKNSEKKQTDLPNIDGLDTGLGMRRVVGKKSLYMNLLGKFISNQKETPDLIRQSLSAEDRSTAERLAHSAKGVCGNIGASGLQAMAAELEKMIKEGTGLDQLETKLETFSVSLASLIRQLEECLPEAGPSEQTTEIDAAKTAAVASRLAQLLANDDGESVDLFEAENALFLNLFGATGFASFEHAIKQFDFEKALELLKQQAEKHNISL